MTGSISWVVLTTGTREPQLRTALSSIRGQTVNGEIVVVFNGASEIALGGDVVIVHSEVNRGIPGGRNLGATTATGDLLFFLDDDAVYETPATCMTVLRAFEADPKLGVVSLRIDDPSGHGHESRHVPRLRSRDPHRSSYVTTFLGGACAIRRSVFSELGGYPDHFFYSHEESDLAWRVLDSGYKILYLGTSAVLHPASSPPLDGVRLKTAARNRVFLARRRLPLALGIVHVVVWAVIMLARATSSGRRDVLRGLANGLRDDAGDRKPISWGTAWTMTKLGRPPIL